MKSETKQLRSILNEHLGWNKARITCFVSMLLAMFVTKTINLTSLAVAFDSDAKISSRYKRIQRFFRFFNILDSIPKSNGLTKWPEIEQNSFL